MDDWAVALTGIRDAVGDAIAARLVGSPIDALGVSYSPSPDAGARIGMARQLIRLLLSDEEVAVVRAWLVTQHPDLDGRAPADAFSDQPDRVMWAAARFIENTCEGCIG